jgi:flagellar hook-associated protein 2
VTIDGEAGTPVAFLMAGLQLSGLASGLDWKSLVDTLIDLERTPATRLEREKSTNNTRLGALNALTTRLTDLKAAVTGLKSSGLARARTATFSSGTSGWSANASAGAAVGSYQFAVTKLATTAKSTGASDIGRGIAATNDVSGVTLSTLGTSTAVTAGAFTINGARVTVDPTESLQDLFDRISTATNGDVTASYDATADRITLTGAGPITLGAANDTSNFLTVTRLHNNGSGTITSSSALGAANIQATLGDARLRSAITAVDADGKGSFSINGVAIDYDVDTDSISSVMARINASTAGVIASFDAASDRMVLTNRATGDIGITVDESAGGLLGALGLTSGAAFARGQNAEFTVNGGNTFISTSNTFTAETHGIAGLSVTATSESTQTVAVGADTSQMKTAIETFIAKFNAVQTYIDEQTRISTSSDGTVTSGTLASNREVQHWARTFRSAAFGAVAGLTGTVSRMEQLGIDFTAGTSQLAIKDASKLEAALTNRPEDVETFFGATTGFVARFDGLFTSFTGIDGSGGLLKSQKDNLSKANTSLDKQIADIDRRLVERRAQLEAAFIAMEQAQSRLQQMQSQITNAFFKDRSK